MLWLRWLHHIATCILMIVVFTSCIGRPTTVRQPSIDASSAGSQAMETYDTNGDGKVAGDELEKAPALKAALPRLDANQDGGVSADEVAARVNAWKEMGTAMTVVRCTVTLDGRPLPGAQVIFEPEAFLGEEIKTAVGTTNEYGDVSPAIPPEQRPSPDLPGGVNLGLYKVRITKEENGKEILPAQYNTNTTLGYEVAFDDPGIQSNNIVFALKSGQ